MFSYKNFYKIPYFKGAVNILYNFYALFAVRNYCLQSAIRRTLLALITAAADMHTVISENGEAQQKRIAVI